MSDTNKKPQTLLDNPPAGSDAGLHRSMNRFGWFLILLMLACGLFILLTNGLYYWFCLPIKNAYLAANTSMLDGMPDEIRTAEDRLSFYTVKIDALQDLPVQLDNLNRQPWAFAVQLKNDLSVETIQELLDQAKQGQAAVSTYYGVYDEIEEKVADFGQQPSEPPADAKLLNDIVTWYAGRVSKANELETLFTNLSYIEHLDLVGALFTREELGIDTVKANVDQYRELVLNLQDLIVGITDLEVRLDGLYAMYPEKANLVDFQAACDAMLLEQGDLSQRLDSIAETVLPPLQDAYVSWQYGQADRTRFISELRIWWQYAVQVEQSISSAKTDRATAHRYIEASLKETNVETAYRWTLTAQEYRNSMDTAIDFANIAIERANQQLQKLTAIRQVYRPEIDMEADILQVSKYKTIQADEFWLEG